MAHSADASIPRYGKCKRTSKKERQARTKAARGAILANTTSIYPEHETLEIDRDSFKENNHPLLEPSTPLQKAETLAQSLRKQVDKHRKKASYWKRKTVESKESLKDLEKIFKEQEEEMKGKVDQQEKVLQEKVQQVEALETQLQREMKRRKLEAEEHTALHTHMQNKVGEYQRHIHALRTRIGRIPTRLSTALNRVARRYDVQADEKKKFFLKNSKRVIPDEARDIFLDLVAIDEVPANKVTRVFKRIADVFGISVEGDINRRSIGRIVKEGGNASKLQFGKAVLDSRGHSY